MSTTAIPGRPERLLYRCPSCGGTDFDVREHARELETEQAFPFCAVRCQGCGHGTEWPVLRAGRKRPDPP